MANVANARVVTGRATVSARVSRGAITVSANTPVDENTVGASVQQPQRNASANVQTRNNTVQAQMPMGGTTDHSHLRNLDYEHSEHTGFQRELIPDESITIDEEGHIHANGESYTAGYGIDITNGVISTTLQREHKSYYDTSTYTLYEGIAPNGSTTSQAVWTIITIVSNAVGTIVSTSTATNQVWNYN